MESIVNEDPALVDSSSPLFPRHFQEDFSSIRDLNESRKYELLSVLAWNSPAYAADSCVDDIGLCLHRVSRLLPWSLKPETSEGVRLWHESMSRRRGKT